jgi:pimeloyl-ACP methyl ester carboxylesterase
MSTAPLEQLVQAIPIEAGTTATNIEVHSGIARHFPRVYGNLVRQVGDRSETAVIIVHPTSNFLGHPLLEPFAAAGLPIVGLNTRYVQNEAAVIMENILLDLGAAIRWMKEQLGYRRVILAGFSGGGPLVSYYQSQAERPTVTSTPAGDPPDLTQANLPPADGLLLIAPNAGRARLLSTWIDPSVLDEHDPDSRDPALDLYHPDRKVPYDRAWLVVYREAQLARIRRITGWVLGELGRLKPLGIRDRAFVVYRTVAEPRYVDLTLDPSDREAGNIYGDVRLANESPGALGRYTSLRSWLSSWSIDHSESDALKHLPRVSVPVCVIDLTADEGALPSEIRAICAAIPEAQRTVVRMHGMNHYFRGQPEARAQAAEHVKTWLASDAFTQVPGRTAEPAGHHVI